MKIKKIAIVIGAMGYGGAERITSYLANYLSNNKIKVYLISTSYSNSVYKLNGVEHIHLKRKIANTNVFSRFISLIVELRKTIKSIRPDVVLGMMAYNGVASSLGLVGTRIPVIVSERIDPASTNSRSKIEKLFIKIVLGMFAKGVVFQTNEAKNYYPKIVQKKSVVIPNPLMVDELPEIERPKLPTYRIISVGRLEQQKNHELLIRAFSNVYRTHPEYQLYIFGNGKLRDKLEKLINELELKEKVHLPGVVNNVFDHLQQSDIFVLSSDFEGMPNALIEAMAMGVPVISTDCRGGGASFLIRDGENGLLVPVGDQVALENAILRLIQERDFAIRIGQNASKIREKLDWNIICKNWVDFLVRNSR